MSRSLVTPSSKSTSARSLAAALVAAVMPDLHNRMAGMLAMFSSPSVDSMWPTYTIYNSVEFYITVCSEFRLLLAVFNPEEKWRYTVSLCVFIYGAIISMLSF